MRVTWVSRCLPRPVGVVLFVLVFTGAVAWNFRPLNDTERKLIGTWALRSDPRIRLMFNSYRDAHLRLTRGDRLKSRGETAPEGGSPIIRLGTWSASETSMKVWRRSHRRGSLLWPRERPLSPEDQLTVATAGWGSRTEYRKIQFDDEESLRLDSDLYVRIQE